MINTLNKINNILSKSNTNCIIDSGTLLFLVRDGKLVKCDEDDIDLAIINPKSLPTLFKVLNDNNIKFKKHYIDNILYKLTFKVDLPNIIEIRVFYLKNKFYYSPFLPLKKSIVINYVKNIFIFKFIWNYFLKKYLYNYFSKTILFNYYYWKIPQKYFYNKRKYKKLSNIYLPEHYDDYLSFRYGNWNLTKDNWDVRNDGGLINAKI